MGPLADRTDHRARLLLGQQMYLAWSAGTLDTVSIVGTAVQYHKVNMAEQNINT